MSRTTSATLARQHLAQLRTAGISVGHVTRRSGIPHRMVLEIAAGNRQTIPLSIELRLLAVTAPGTTTGSPVSARGAQRRLQSLHAVGWSTRSIGEVLGWSAQRVELLMQATTISPTRHQLIVDVYELLWNEAPSDSVDADAARALALNHEWPAPMAWDDIDEDAAPAVPTSGAEIIDDVAIALALSGTPVHLTRAERLEAVRQLGNTDLSGSEIAARLGCSRSQLYRLMDEVAAEATILEQPAPNESTAATPALEHDEVTEHVDQAKPAPAEAPEHALDGATSPGIPVEASHAVLAAACDPAREGLRLLRTAISPLEVERPSTSLTAVRSHQSAAPCIATRSTQGRSARHAFTRGSRSGSRRRASPGIVDRRTTLLRPTTLRRSPAHASQHAWTLEQLVAA